jgi:MFS family permease
MAAEPQPSPSIFSRDNILSLYLPAVTLALGNGIAAPALPVYAKSFEVTFGVAALVLIVYEVGGALATLPTGFLIDRIGRRKVLLAGPILVAISSILVALAHSFPELLVYRFIGGWARQMWMLSRLTVIADTGAERQRGRQITGMIAMESSGRLLGPAIGGFLASAWGVRVPFLVHAALSIAAIVPSFALIRETAPIRLPRAGGAGSGGEPTVAVGLAALLTLPVLVFFCAQFLAAVTRGTLVAGSLHLYAVYAYNVGPDTIGILAASAGIVGIPILFSTGHIMDRFGRRATAVPGFVFLGLALCFMAVTSLANLPFGAYVLAFFSVQTSQSITAGNMQVIGSVIAPAHLRGRFFGVWRLIGEVGSAISPAVFALLAETYKYGVGFMFLSITSLCTAILLAIRVGHGARDERT